MANSSGWREDLETDMSASGSSPVPTLNDSGVAGLQTLPYCLRSIFPENKIFWYFNGDLLFPPFFLHFLIGIFLSGIVAPYLPFIQLFSYISIDLWIFKKSLASCPVLILCILSFKLLQVWLLRALSGWLLYIS